MVADKETEAVFFGIVMRLLVKHGKDTIEVDTEATATVSQLKEELATRTGVQPAMQKLMFKVQLKEDAKTLQEVGLKDGTKLMLIGTSVEQVLSMAIAPKVVSEAPEDDKAKKEAEAAEMKKHEKVVKLGVPADAEPPLLGQQVPFPKDRSVTGMLNAKGERIRLTLKPSSDELWISTSTGCAKLPYNSIVDVTATPIPDHPGYSIFTLNAGHNHKVPIYFLPTHYARSLKITLVGYDPSETW